MAPRSLSSILILATFLTTGLTPFSAFAPVALANDRPNPEPARCLSLAQTIGASRVWWGQHIGYRERSDIFEWGPRKETFNDIGCFRSRKDCEDWLYWKRTEYPEFRIAKPCRKGL
ncbi:hypothetical protein SAMN04515647_3029 [Cohaesibacter sp. ES.047]|uniref:hypothetical protein n=1 Tax=Cohaesibacter sp. ES.047 TaxID=1798205 RepID=UPI000BBFB623|nr:hypothetical protein [Cohaesibacter sp. ES.047]SNY92760.1 hypothetical protein SAMN04515647_3029 [Cohaesibacter sp. ES.047]